MLEFLTYGLHFLGKLRHRGSHTLTCLLAAALQRTQQDILSRTMCTVVAALLCSCPPPKHTLLKLSDTLQPANRIDVPPQHAQHHAGHSPVPSTNLLAPWRTPPMNGSKYSSSLSPQCERTTPSRTSCPTPYHTSYQPIEHAAHLRSFEYSRASILGRTRQSTSHVRNGMAVDQRVLVTNHAR